MIITFLFLSQKMVLRILTAVSRKFDFPTFLCSQWNSRKNFFIIGLRTWNSKISSENWGKCSFVFFLFENQFFKFKIKITFPALYWFLKNKKQCWGVNPTTNEDVVIKLAIGLKISKTYNTCYVYFNFFSLNIR